MDFVLLKSDGNIKQTNFTDFIQQNNDGVNSIFVSVDDLDIDSHSLTAIFVLPDGTTSEEEGELKEHYEYEEGKFANGYLVTITQNETKLPGLVYLTLLIVNSTTQKKLYSYRATLTINKTVDLDSITFINLSQYLNLKSYIDGQLQNYIPYGDDVNLGEHDLIARNLVATPNADVPLNSTIISHSKIQYNRISGSLLKVGTFNFPDKTGEQTFAMVSDLPFRGTYTNLTITDGVVTIDTNKTYYAAFSDGTNDVIFGVIVFGTFQNFTEAQDGTKYIIRSDYEGEATIYKKGPNDEDYAPVTVGNLFVKQLN